MRGDSADWMANLQRAVGHQVDLAGFVRHEPPGDPRLALRAPSVARRTALLLAVRTARGKWWAQCHLTATEKANMAVVQALARAKGLRINDLGGRVHLVHRGFTGEYHPTVIALAQPEAEVRARVADSAREATVAADIHRRTSRQQRAPEPRPTRRTPPPQGRPPARAGAPPKAWASPPNPGWRSPQRAATPHSSVRYPQ